MEGIKNMKNIMNKYRGLISETRKYEKKYSELSDKDLKGLTEEFSFVLSKGHTLEEMMPKAFAAVCVAADRTLGMRPYDVQIVGGAVLHKGGIAEMMTGEGKTLVAALPSYLNALTGKGVHVVTVNDYLAERDADEIGQIHRFLGLTVGCVVSKTKSVQRKAAYACDITYVTNTELGFDYLRDNMVMRTEDKVLGPEGFNYCIIDEVDSVLIDEARTPLIISSPSGRSTEIYYRADQFVKNLECGEIIGDNSKAAMIAGEYAERTGDYIVDEKDKTVSLTENGIRKAEEFFHIDNYSASEHHLLQHHINAALRANYLMKLDKDYVLRDGKVMIVDEFTGRVMEDRRYNDGLHQAIEAKEGVEVHQESFTEAKTTYQSFFNKYKKKAGMTGTGASERKEFKEIYHLSVEKIPTNKPVIRIDHPDIVFLTKKEKYKAIVADVVATHKKGQPVLLGTPTIEVSEELSRLLKQAGIRHRVLNAKNHAKEAEIISHAGEYGTVTIATNMAGRGTDIKLTNGARSEGGLKVIAAERHDSRRVDDQLRGRSGRQGDPGESIFYLSLEDEVLRIYGRKNLAERYRKMGMEEGEKLSGSSINRFVSTAQKNVEGSNFMARKNVLEYDEVLNDQRELIYAERDRIMKQTDFTPMVADIFETIAENASKVFSKKTASQVTAEIGQFIPNDYTPEKLAPLSRKELKELLLKDMNTLYNEAKAVSKSDAEKYIFLRNMDRSWKKHLADLEHLQQGIAAQSYGQRDPRTEFAIAAYDLFDDMLTEISLNCAKAILHLPEVARQVNSGESV